MKLAEAFAIIVPAERGVGFRAYDGSSVGTVGADVVMELRTPLGLIPEDDGTFTVLYTAKVRGENFWALGMARLTTS